MKYGVLLGIALIATLLALNALTASAHSGHVPIQPEWNLIGLPGGETPQDVHAAHPCVRSIHRWDAEAQAYQSWYASAPPWMQETWVIDRLEGHWVYCDPALLN